MMKSILNNKTNLYFNTEEAYGSNALNFACLLVPEYKKLMPIYVEYALDKRLRC